MHGDKIPACRKNEITESHPCLFVHTSQPLILLRDLLFGNSVNLGAQQETAWKMQANFTAHRKRPSSLTNKDNDYSFRSSLQRCFRPKAIVRWLRQAHQIILKLSDHHAILLTFYVVSGLLIFAS